MADVVAAPAEVMLVDPINDLADIQQAVADVVAAPDSFCDTRVCVLCQFYFNSLDLTPEHGEVVAI